jgi:glycosyltransferase involved in cell wall biosynthesis
MKTRKILLLNTQMEAGGAQKAMLVLARGLKSRGYEVIAVTMYDKADYIDRFKELYGCDIIDLKMKRPNEQKNKVRKIYDFFEGIKHLYKLLKEERIEIIQTFSHYSNIIGPIIAAVCKVPVRVTSQRMYLKKAWLLSLDRFIENSPLVTAMVSVSESIRGYSITKQKIKPSKIVTIYNGIDTHFFNCASFSSSNRCDTRRSLGIKEGDNVIIVVARLHPIKGHIYLLEAIPGILKTFPNSMFFIVGEGEVRLSLERRVQELQIQDSVLFLGARQDIKDLLCISDLFVLPSLSEGMPNSILEAMACEVPVISSEVGGCREIIINGETGVFVQPANSDELAKAICLLLGNPDMRRKLAYNALQRVIKEFSEEKNVSSFIDLYEMIINKQKNFDTNGK